MNLPEYAVDRLNMDTAEGSFDMLAVRCPRKGCEKEHWVVAGPWVSCEPVKGRSDEPEAIVVGRPCPYCSRAAAVPAELVVVNYPKEDKPESKRKLVVKRRKK